MSTNLKVSLENVEVPEDSRLAAAIGVFDGVHIGHQSLIGRVIAVCRANARWIPAVLTFDPHPATVFAPEAAPLLLGTLDERVELLFRYGIERVIVAKFDRPFAELTAQQFVQSVLVNRLRVGAVIVGEDFRYGRNRLGDVSTLRKDGYEWDFEVISVPPVTVDRAPARSTIIRQELAAGNVEQAARLLGRPYLLRGVVEHGRQLGRSLGYPTANLGFDTNLIVPGAGVYGGRVSIRGSWNRAAISVGNNPTVAPVGVELPRTVEAFIMDDFNQDIYGEEVDFEFVTRLRGMEKFSGVDELVAQMKDDVLEIKRRLS